MIWSRASRGSSKSRAIQHIDVEHAGDTYRVKLRSARTARRLTLRVSHSTGDVVLTLPHRVPLADATAFAQRHAAWIGARLRRLPEPAPFVPGALIPIRGFHHRIVHAPDRRGTVWVETPTSAADVPEEPLLCVAGDLPHLARRLTDYLKRSAKHDLETAVNHYCALLDTPSRPVTVRDTTSRWGSCSANGSLNFSWRLILAPAFVLDYLAAHEVAHLVHMNHSRKFWELTKKLCADTDRAEAWLNAHGPQLYRYGKARGED
ncbi:MAG: M48 family metallopeptidase [Beijerinckiaceae bacterium]